jgi:hypothetical protein
MCLEKPVELRSQVGGRVTHSQSQRELCFVQALLLSDNLYFQFASFRVHYFCGLQGDAQIVGALRHQGLKLVVQDRRLLDADALTHAGQQKFFQLQAERFESRADRIQENWDMVRQTPFKLSLYEFSDFHLLVRSNISTLVRRSEMFGVYLFNSRMNSTSSSERGRSIATVTNARAKWGSQSIDAAVLCSKTLYSSGVSTNRMPG